MRFTPRPKFWTSSTAVFLCLFLGGLALWAVLFHVLPPTRFAGGNDDAQATTQVGLILWRDFYLSQRSSFWASLAAACATAVITVSVFELLKCLMEFWMGIVSARRAFDQFFGEDASHPNRAGVVVLQVERIDDTLAHQMAADFTAKMSSADANRFFKARMWINRWDAEGAKAIREAFQKSGYNPPELTHADRGIPPDFGPLVPFEMSMGLGFSEETIAAVKRVCDPWMRIRQTDVGDTVELLNHLVPPNLNRLERAPADPGTPGFTQLRPKGWELTTWLDSPENARDYAIILRHTNPNSKHRRVLFVLAGFTEYGTAAAGHYLASHWQELWQAYVKTSVRGSALGDCFIVVEGPSGGGRFSEWAVDPNLPPLTPENLFMVHRVDCEWSQRLGVIS
ncbi:MAG: hypothetical protein GEU82_02655 [Luteitalea sp.]|nr:hypothetical protein [Luteitalea sp.]